MIMIVLEDGALCPVIICDICGQKIEETGNVLVGPEGMLFTHKECDPHTTDDGMYYPWMGLSLFLVYLIMNSKLDFRRVVELATEFERSKA